LMFFHWLLPQHYTVIMLNVLQTKKLLLGWKKNNQCILIEF